MGQQVEHRALNDVEARSHCIDCPKNEVDREAWTYCDAVG